MNNIRLEKEIEAWARQQLPVYEFMDLNILSVSGGLYKCFVPLSANTGNHIKTVHAAFQWASAEILGGLVVLANRKDDKYVPVVKSLNIEFNQPALTDIVSEAAFSMGQVEEMNAALATSGRYDFELASVIKDSGDKVVAEALGHYAVRLMG